MRFANVTQVCCIALACVFSVAGISNGDEPGNVKTDDRPVSFYRQVRPILQRHCVGCHQPAKRAGKLLLTTFEGFKKGGENGKSFTPGKPAESLVVDYISGDKPEMPRNAKPLKKEQIALVARWIKEGAKDDTPEAAKDTITAANPPRYVRPPVVTALAYSPDGKLLAVSGFHETLLHKADGGGIVGRLVGTAQRIESLAFSPDGKLLAVAGGNPSLFGEVQIWNVARRKLVGSGTFTFDVCYGVSFSPDGKQLAFGAADNKARVVTVPGMKPIMRFDAHTGYVLGTTFSMKGDHVITVSRDQSMKLVIVKNAQLVDNITSITPGALKGPLMAVQRHPLKEQVLVAGENGQPKLFKIFRTRKRIIGDDFNLIRNYDKLPGRIYSLQFNKDGSRFVVGSSTAKDGTARIYTTGVYDEKTANNGGGLGQTFQEIAARSKQKALVHELKGTGPVFAVAYRPDGNQVAVGGFDGKVRLFDANTGKLVKVFVPVTITAATAAR
jgi:WD40 repeat protein/mono/diheme cytochrome c family protein